MVLTATAGASSPHNPIASRSALTGALASSTSIASNARSFGPATATGCPPRRTSNGPRIENSTSGNDATAPRLSADTTETVAALGRADQPPPHRSTDDTCDLQPSGKSTSRHRVRSHTCANRLGAIEEQPPRDPPIAQIAVRAADDGRRTAF